MHNQNEQNTSKERCRCSGRGYPCSKEGTVLGCPCKQGASHRLSPRCWPGRCWEQESGPGVGVPFGRSCCCYQTLCGMEMQSGEQASRQRGPVRAAPRGESRISGKERLTDHRRHETPHTLAGHPPQLFSSSKIQLRKDLRFHTGLGCSQEPGKD